MFFCTRSGKSYSILLGSKLADFFGHHVIAPRSGSGAIKPVNDKAVDIYHSQLEELSLINPAGFLHISCREKREKKFLEIWLIPITYDKKLTGGQVFDGCCRIISTENLCCWNTDHILFLEQLLAS